YKTAEFLSRKVSVRKDFIGSMKLAFGMFVFLLFYIVQILFIISLTKWYWGLLFALSLYPCGLFAVNYINQWYRLRGHLIFRRLYSKKRNVINRLQVMRNGLLEELDEGRLLYLESKLD
ncbi:MAG: hypothetical protein KJN59_12975, partial [Bacteroidia bacterium]|nr:hypothetical protein [Bacteroidia bacterium]